MEATFSDRDIITRVVCVSTHECTTCTYSYMHVLLCMYACIYNVYICALIYISLRIHSYLKRTQFPGSLPVLHDL